MNNLNPIKIILKQIYLLELENYDIKRFSMAWIKGFLQTIKGNRKNITWTPKMIGVVFFSLLLCLVTIKLFVSIFISGLVAWLVVIVLFITLTPLFFISLSIATIIFYPADYLTKAWIIKKATNKIRKLKNLKVIAITGSYGKTTMKEVLSTTLASKFNIIKTKDNKNTSLGISRQILSDIDEDTEIFIVEMGAYKKGDIALLCGIVKPNISVLTGINEAHLERFSTIENTIKTKFEIVRNCAPDGIVVLNADDKRTMRNLSLFIGNQVAHYFSSNNSEKSKYKFSNKTFRQDGSGISFNIQKEGEEIGNIKTSFLADYIIGDVIATFIIGEELGMTQSEIKIGLMNIKPQEHRLSVTKTPNDIVVIDDSYNGNPQGVSEAINALSQFKKRRKVYVTPGLVETGEAKEEIHTNIGELLSGVADLIVLIQNSVTPYIKKGLKQGGFDEKNIKVFSSTQKAHSSIGGMLKKGDVVLFQNDWPDNYN